MLAIGRALMSRPGSCSSTSRRWAWRRSSSSRSSRSSRRSTRQGTTILLVEQNALQALDVAHRGYVLQTGKVILADRRGARARTPTSGGRTSGRSDPTMTGCRGSVHAPKARGTHDACTDVPTRRATPSRAADRDARAVPPGVGPHRGDSRGRDRGTVDAGVSSARRRGGVAAAGPTSTAVPGCSGFPSEVPPAPTSAPSLPPDAAARREPVVLTPFVTPAQLGRRPLGFRGSSSTRWRLPSSPHPGRLVRTGPRPTSCPNRLLRRPATRRRPAGDDHGGLAPYRRRAAGCRLLRADRRSCVGGPRRARRCLRACRGNRGPVERCRDVSGRSAVEPSGGSCDPVASDLIHLAVAGSASPSWPPGRYVFAFNSGLASVLDGMVRHPSSLRRVLTASLG